MRPETESWLQLVPLLKQLFVKGVCSLPKGKGPSFMGGQLESLLCGIAASADIKSEETKDMFFVQWVAARPLLELRQQVASDNEAIAALMATDLEVRSSWLSIMAARVKEAAQMQEGGALVQLVTQLGEASSWVEASLSGAKLAATPLGELERKLLGTAAELAPATPVLCRVLSAAAWLKSLQESPLPVLKPVDGSGFRPDINWCVGRLLGIPGTHLGNAFHSGLMVSGDFLLSGGINNEVEASDADDMEPLLWVLANPWAFLLTSLIYAQDSWAAEQRGGILLELPGGQHPFSPTEIQLLVMGSDESEVLCGTLGGLILRFLESRSIDLFPAPLSVSELDSRLGSVVHALLTKRVWRYYDGLSGEQGYYRIDPDFADLCYRRLGSRIFQRYGRTIWQGFRLLAEQWGQEKRGSGMGERNLTEIRGVTL